VFAWLLRSVTGAVPPWHPEDSRKEHRLKGFVLNFTPTGMVPTRAMTPHVPITPAEIVRDVLACAEQGVNMVHLHARDADGHPTFEKEVYARIIGGIREQRDDLVLCVSTSGRDHREFWQRSQVLELTDDLKPEFASLTLSSLNFARQESVNAPGMVRDLAKKMLDNGIRPELECFDLGMINVARYLMERDLVTPPYYVNLILGNVAGAQADPLSLGALIHALPPGAYWSVGGVGSSQTVAIALALAAGGGVRVGLEDNLWWDDGRQRLASNPELVARTVALAALLGREPAGTLELRHHLALPVRPEVVRSPPA